MPVIGVVDKAHFKIQTKMKLLGILFLLCVLTMPVLAQAFFRPHPDIITPHHIFIQIRTDIIQNHTSPPAVQIIIQTFYQLSVLIEKEEPLYLMLYFSFSTSGPV